ncbi:MAG: hypothetical protein MJZ21_06175 [archaeon]|nr:hypothetical protein [archaeon]
MASSLDRSTREAEIKKKEASRTKREEKKTKTAAKKERSSAKREYKKNSAARYETRSMLRTMAYSAGILVIAFFVFEALLLVWKYWLLPDGEDFTRDDTYWHLINIADTCIGFLIGLTAMDALTFFNQNQKNKRDEERAIIRHNRIVKPCIDMYLARKNSLITPDGENFDHFKVITSASARDLKDMYSPSSIISDAGNTKIVAFKYYLKKLDNAFLNMAEDINFDYNPEVCDAMMKFLNETTYGYAALDAVASYGQEGNKNQKMALIRKLKEVPDDIDMAEAEGELNTALVLLHMIHAQEDALARYLEVIKEIDTEKQRRPRRFH